jgi:gamma-glutamylcyclotransferase (GGCT)/AIG2-like uncharacterized protein YtfP
MDMDSMAHRCPAAEPIDKAWLSGYKLVFRRGVATVEPCKDEYVAGALWNITDECLASLDRFEGYPRWYGREEIVVETAEGITKALVYIMAPGFAEEGPGLYYLNTLLSGYADFKWGVDESNNLLKIAYKGKRRRISLGREN